MGTPAGAGLPGQAAQVAGAVAQQREGLLGDAGKYQLPDFPFWQYFPGLGIDNLSDKVVFLDMHSSLFLAFKGYAWPGDFSEAIDVICFDAEGFFNVLPHFLRPWLCPEDAGFQLNLVL